MILHSLVSGIDEAGRGSVFGPLFIVGVTLDLKSLNFLVKKGLKDSKLFSGQAGQRKRSELALKIQEIATELEIVEIKASEIEKTLRNRPNDNLNLLEIRYISKIVLQITSTNMTIDTLSSPKYTKNQLIIQLNKLEKSLKIQNEINKVDSCRFTLITNVDSRKEVIIAKKADKIFPIVSAASCIAKHLRDQKLRKIEEEYGLPQSILGKGYPNEKDRNVMKFLEEYKKEIIRKEFPFIRYSWSWSPLQDLIKASYKTLDSFFK